MGSEFKGVLAALACAASLAANAAASSYTIVDLTPEGAGHAGAISASGIVAGCRNTPTATRAFLYENGQRRDLDAPEGSTSCALAVNSQGVAAGRIDGEITVWDGPVARRLGAQGNVTGISDGGVVVGSLIDPATNVGRAFMWANGIFTDLGIAGTAIGINHRGQIAILSSDRLLYMYENGSLRNLADASVTNAFGLNDRGEIVGMTSFGHGPEPFIYDGVVRRIPGAGSYAGAVAINNVGQILGSGEGIYGYLIEAGQVTTLDSLAGASTGTTAWRHNEGKAINDRGWIVGEAAGESFHAFLMMPKEAAPAAAVAGNPAQRKSSRSEPLIRSARNR